MTNFFPGCEQFCSAEKCAELEARIGALEQALELLEASFEAHVNQEIPKAHEFNPYLRVTAGITDNGYLIIDVEVNDANDNDTVKLPSPRVNVEADTTGNSALIDVTVGDESDFATFDFPVYQVNVQADTTGNSALIDVTVGDESDFATFDFPVYQVNVQADTTGNSALIDVTVGDESDFATFDFPTFKPFVTVDVFSLDNDTFAIKVSVNGDSDQDFFTIKIPEMNCDELEQKLDLCCSEINNALSALSLQLSNAESILNQAVDEVKNYVTVDISGSTRSNYQCKKLLENPDDPNSEPLPLPPQSITEIVEYSGTGLIGIHENLKIINRNLTEIYQASCQGVNDPLEVDLLDLFTIACGENNLPEVNEFGSKQQYFDFIKNGLTNLLANKTSSILLKLLKFTPGTIPTFVVGTSLSYALNYMIEKATTQQNQGLGKVCSKIDELEDRDHVSIVASPKYVTNVDGKVLILHFVTLDNYPKRKADSSYRPIQIPGAKESYDWLINFDEVRWIQGNQYGELILNEYKATVSGWFESETAANTFFDWVLTVTLGTQKDRNFPKRLNGRTDIVEQESRIHRAFIESVNAQGKAICHRKYVPVIPEEDNEN